MSGATLAAIFQGKISRWDDAAIKKLNPGIALPSTGIGAKGNEGVAGNVAQISGAIGYVEYAYAKQNHLACTKLVNKAGQTVEPTVESFRAGAASADWVGAAKNDYYVLFLDSPGRTGLADRGDHLRAGLQEPARPEGHRRSAHVLPVGL